MEAVTFNPELLIKFITSPMVEAELNVTVPDAEPFTILILFKIKPLPPSKSEIRVEVVKAGFKFAPLRVPFLFPKIPKSDAVVPPETSVTVKAWDITVFVSTSCKPFPVELIDAVTLIPHY